MAVINQGDRHSVFPQAGSNLSSASGAQAPAEVSPMWAIALLDRGPVKPRILVAVTDGRTDRLAAASSWAHAVAQIRAITDAHTITDLVCPAGSLAAERLPHMVTRISRKTSQMDRAEWLILVAVARLAETGAPVETREASRVLKSVRTAGAGPMPPDDGGTGNPACHPPAETPVGDLAVAPAPVPDTVPDDGRARDAPASIHDLMGTGHA